MAKGKFHEWIEEDGLIKIQGWARDGLTDEQIAHNMGISYTTLKVWKNRFPSITATLKQGKEVVDRQVENALFKSAIGYSYDEITQENVFDEKEGAYVLKVTKVVRKEVAPNSTSQIFWLKNRKPAEWRDRKDVEHSGGLDIKQQLTLMTDEELVQLAGELDVEE